MRRLGLAARTFFEQIRTRIVVEGSKSLPQEVISGRFALSEDSRQARLSLLEEEGVGHLELCDTGTLTKKFPENRLGNEYGTPFCGGKLPGYLWDRTRAG